MEEKIPKKGVKGKRISKMKESIEDASTVSSKNKKKGGKTETTKSISEENSSLSLGEKISKKAAKGKRISKVKESIKGTSTVSSNNNNKGGKTETTTSKSEENSSSSILEEKTPKKAVKGKRISGMKESTEDTSRRRKSSVASSKEKKKVTNRT